ncbi:MAG: glutamine-hydrolyzing carbamoyl-phosphate synthase small subunit [Chloroflexi bacterium]|nr:glutamine-hydrolyzing carbamoyl-phosphate synthase small subunit [Chloroflexota bacterium]
MTRNAALVLEDGRVFFGHRIGAAGDAWGEVVFNTAMTGYQEMLTDPSYAGQVLTLTYPLIGNYGLEPLIDESARVQPRALIVRSDCRNPSHPHGGITLHEYLLAAGIPGLSGVDTRALTRALRARGVMQGVVTDLDGVERARTRLADLPAYDSQDFADSVSTSKPYGWRGGPVDPTQGQGRYHIAVLDEGLKYNILRHLQARDCRVTVLPVAASAQEILAIEPDGVLLSPGPGDPALRDAQIATTRQLLGRVPLMGICLGHQLIARSLGAETFKLKFGHRGGNHPVRELASGRVSITVQNHGYAVDPEGLRGGARVSHINLHDDTVEGITHDEYPVISIQYHSEASPGPLDNNHLFDDFLDLVSKGAG